MADYYDSDLFCFPVPPEPDTAATADPPCDGCEGCLTLCRYEPLPNEDSFFELIEGLTMEIIELEAEIVRTRQVLAEYLPERWADGLKQDILSGLSGCFAGNFEAYDAFINTVHCGDDPLNCEEHDEYLFRLRDGVDKTTYYHLLPRNN